MVAGTDRGVAPAQVDGDLGLALDADFQPRAVKRAQREHLRRHLEHRVLGAEPGSPLSPRPAPDTSRATQSRSQVESSHRRLRRRDRRPIRHSLPLGGERASSDLRPRRLHRTTSDSADRGCAGARFALAEQASGDVGRAHLVLVPASVCRLSSAKLACARKEERAAGARDDCRRAPPAPVDPAAPGATGLRACATTAVGGGPVLGRKPESPTFVACVDVSFARAATLPS